MIYVFMGTQPRKVEYIVGHSAAEFVDATTELFPKPSCGCGRLLLLIYSGQQSQDGQHAGVELTDNADVKTLAITPLGNG